MSWLTKEIFVVRSGGGDVKRRADQADRRALQKDLEFALA